MTTKPKRLLTFKMLKPEKGWPYSRQHTYRLIEEGRFPRPKKFPGCAINFWTDDQIDDHYSTLEGDEGTSVPPIRTIASRKPTIAGVCAMDENKISGESMRPHPRVETLGMREPVAHGDVKPFGPDNPPPRSPGRPKGARNKLGGDLKELILQAARETGFIRKDENGEMIGTGEEGALGYLKWAAIHKADRFIALVSRVMSQHVVANVTHSVMTRAETEARLKECGLPIELLEHLRKAPVVLDDDENEDPYGLNADVTSQDASGVTSPE